MFIQATKLHKSFDQNVVLRDVSFSIAPKSRIGLVGENGAGKTTLLKIIQEKTPYDGGSLVVKKGISIAYVPQTPTIQASQRVRDILQQYSDRPYKIEEILDTLGVTDIADKKFEELSGGEKTKVYLARIALYDADLLLLDEPTNHLDREGLDWLEKYLKEFKGAYVIISHDRYFLDKTVNEIYEIEDGNLKIYGGNYSFYREQKNIEKEAYRNQYQSQQKEIKRLHKAATQQKQEGNRKNADRKNDRDNDKFGVNFFADRASKKLHSSGKNIDMRLEHIDKLDKPKKESVLDIYFKPSGAQNSNVLSITHMDIGHDETLFHIDSLSILYGNRIALQGENGSGKTTLVTKILDHQNHDEIQVGPGVQIGYLSQDHSEMSGDETALDLLLGVDGIDTTAAYKILSQINISPDQMKQNVSDFSSGQKSKLLLAKIMATGANFIILDEPTNHLDFQSMDVIEQALRNFKGTLLVISHDRYFLEQIGINKYLSIENNEIRQKKLEN